MAPLISTRATSDWLDVAAYSVGAIIASAYWNRPVGFDLLAPIYDLSETIVAGPLQRVRTAFLGELEGRARVLSLGEGHGRFAQAYLQRFPSASLTCVEASSGTRRQAERRLRGSAGRVIWIDGDVEEASLEGPYDAIVACLVLDCFEAAALVTGARTAACAPGTRRDIRFLSGDDGVAGAGVDASG